MVHILPTMFFFLFRTYEGEDVLSLSCELLDGKAYQSLVDFDNHLDDISQDWLNRDINRLLDLSLSG